ncbi:MAG TPA: hypothetical protein VGS22_04770 [Thermoanaerobaculia bacterium]|jgi:hypothetical protein|nr:hypothetical protein [Thermoanaerobaculia bacterium]
MMNLENGAIHPEGPEGRGGIEADLELEPAALNDLPAAERAALARVSGLLAESRISVRPDFRTAVMSALPPAGWESRHPRTWSFPLAACFLLATFGASAVVFFLGGSSAGAGSSLLGAAVAIGNLLEAAVLAGAGLLTATWKGFGLAIGETLSSPLRMILFGAVVAGLNLLLISLVRRRKEAPGILRARR